MAGTLYVVATPIGHLEDITLRALRVLREVSVVAAEDTRRTGNLLRHYDIRTPLISLHEHNERSRAPQLLERLTAGESVALVTDAGTPAISDPGALLVAAARRQGVPLEAVPGPSAVMAALSVAGLPESGFVFLGFPPIRGKTRKRWFASVSTLQTQNVVAFEAPHRIQSTLRELSNSVKWQILVARELTKVHQELLTGTPAEIAARLDDPRGEFTLVIPAHAEVEPIEATPDETCLRQEIGLIANNGAVRSKRQAAKMIAERLGLSTNEVYQAIRALANGEGR